MQKVNSQKANPKKELVEGVDYIIENGNWVFTEKYLLERGYCCQSGCRNCPYENKDGSDANKPSSE